MHGERVEAELAMPPVLRIHGQLERFAVPQHAIRCGSPRENDLALAIADITPFACCLEPRAVDPPDAVAARIAELELQGIAWCLAAHAKCELIVPGKVDRESASHCGIARDTV